MPQPTSDSPLANPSHSALHNFHINVKMFGAVCDGIADDTAAISSAITAALSARGGGSVFLPGPTKITSTITITPTMSQFLHIVGGHSVGSGLVQFGYPPGIKITPPGGTNAAFRVNGVGAAGVTFENLHFQGAGRSVFVDQTANVQFRNCGFESTQAGTPPVAIDDSFWVSFYTCALVAPDTSTVAVNMRSKQNNVISTYLINFENCVFNKGGAKWNQVNTTSEQPGHFYFKSCHTENFNTQPLFDVTSAVGATIQTVAMLDCQHYDSVGTHPPYFRVGSAVTARAICLQGCGEADTRGIQILTGGALNGAVVLNPRGAWTIVDNAGTATAGSSITQKETGLQFVAPIGGPGGAPNETNVFSSNGPTIRLGIPGEANARAGIDVDGKYYWGPGGGTSGFDTNLSRTAGGTLKIADTGGGTGALTIGDGTLSKSTGGRFGLNSGLQITAAGEFVEFLENGTTDAAAGATNTARFYCRDNGAGKTQLCVRFNTGAVQVLATEP